MRKYFFFDIDNTLLVWEGKQTYIPDSAKEALRKLEENGHFTAIATGRSHAMAVGIMQSFGMHNMVSDGGNGLVINDQLLGITPLPWEECIALMRECTEKGYAWGFCPEDSRIRLAPDSRFLAETGDSYMETVVVEGLDPADYPAVYKVFVACPMHEEWRIESLSRLPWCRYGPEYLFVEPTQKEAGIERMMEVMGAPIEDVVVFGDALNDMSMFDKRWTSIAMGNGAKALKARADYVTKSAKEDGIYLALKHYGWIG